MSDWTSIAGAIATKLGAIADIGNVHQNYPITTDWKEFLAAHHYTTVAARSCIRSWIIQRSAMREHWQTQTQSYLEHEINLLCFFGYADGITTGDTEAEFQNFMELVFNALRSDYSFGGIFDTRQPAEIVIDPVPIRFGKVGCHAGRIVVRGEIDKTF